MICRVKDWEFADFINNGEHLNAINTDNLSDLQALISWTNKLETTIFTDAVLFLQNKSRT